LLPLAPLLGDATRIDVRSTAQVDAIASEFRRNRVADVVIEGLREVSVAVTVLGAVDPHAALAKGDVSLDHGLLDSFVGDVPEHLANCWCGVCPSVVLGCEALERLSTH